jgi:biotin carboxyl carrier protein
MRLFAHSDGKDFELDVRREGERLLVRLGEREVPVSLSGAGSPLATAFLGERRLDFGWSRRDATYAILIEGTEHRVTVRDAREELLSRAARSAPAPRGEADVRAPIPGLVTRLLLAEGAGVRKDQPVLCLDAMKLENEIAAPRDGVVRSLHVRPGQPVEKGQLLFVVE